MLNIIKAKCIILGDSAIGKTAFLNAFLGDNSQFMKSYIMTPGIDIHQKQIRIPETETAVQLYFFDCSGKEFYRSLVLNMCPQTSLILLVFDVTSEDSFNIVETLYDQVQANTEINSPLKGVLLANKVDLVSRRRISPKLGHEMAQKLGLAYFEGSAKDQKGVEAPFFYLANEWYKMYVENEQIMKTIH